MKQRSLSLIFFLFFLILVTVWFSAHMYQRSAAGMLSSDVTETDRFRKMQLSDRMVLQLADVVAQTGISPGDILTVLYPQTPERFFSLPEGMDASAIQTWKSILLKYNRSGYNSVSEAYAAVWNDVECFPVEETDISYENSWMFERNYGGKRGHEGTDLMPPENLSGCYPVVSMTDGVVEKIGWLEQGGYRIGIRSDSGGYFYYAHLDSYAEAFEPGDSVDAGDRLGMMGDSGYGEEGTTGQFDVHLHLGIYIQTENYEELSVNPYWVLRYIQQ